MPAAKRAPALPHRVTVRNRPVPPGSLPHARWCARHCAGLWQGAVLVGGGAQWFDFALPGDAERFRLLYGTRPAVRP